MKLPTPTIESAGRHLSAFLRSGLSQTPLRFGLGLLLLGLAQSQTARAQVTEVNYALTGIAAASSEAYDGVASRGNDGNTDGNWGGGSVTHTAEDDPPWWEVMLTQPETIGRVQIWYRTDCCFDRNSNLTLLLLDPLENELRRVPLTNPFNETPSKPWTAVNFAPGVSGVQKVRVISSKKTWLSVAEVQVIAPYTGVTITPTQAPANQTATESRTATFGPVAATVNGAPQEKLTIQWQRNGVDIPGANGPTYTTPILTMADHNATYSAKFMVSGVSASSTATLTVLKDTVPPTVISANALGNKIGILFDWLMDPASAAATGNYTVTGGTVTAAKLAGDGRSVVLTVTGLSGNNFSVTLNGVKDLGGNSIAAATIAAGTVDRTFTGQDIGGPAIAGDAYSTAAGQYVVTGAGERLFNGDGDQLYFLSTPVTGDFDKKVKITSISSTNAADGWARGGIMVRASNQQSNSIALKLVAGVNEIATRVRTENDALADPAPALGWHRIGRGLGGVKDALPNQWLRLQRVGNAMFLYVGKDGENWSMVGERYIRNLPATLNLGLYAAASIPESLATVAYESYGDVTRNDTTAPAVVSTGTLDKKTVGVKFSEKIAAASATATGNYTLSQGTVTAAEVGVNGDSVYLTVTGLTADNYTVTVSGVKDTAGNTIAAGSQVAGSASTFKAVDVGRFVDFANRPQATDNPYEVGKYVALSSGPHAEVDIVAAGANLWNGQYFHYVYTERTGDFDVQVEVSRFTHATGGGDYAHGGLMARSALYLPGEEFTDAGTKVPFEMNTTYAEAGQGRTALVLYCTQAGDTFEGVGGIVGTDTKDIAGRQGYFGNLRAINAKGDLSPGSTPNQNRWLRLKREGQVFTHYWSYDGVNWKQYDRRDRSSAGPLPDKVVIGYAGQVNDSCCDGAGVNGKPGIYGTTSIRGLGDTVVTKPVIHFEVSGTDMILKWIEGNLQSSPTVGGTYTDVLVSGTNAPSPYSTKVNAGNQFFRLKK